MPGDANASPISPQNQKERQSRSLAKGQEFSLEEMRQLRLENSKARIHTLNSGPFFFSKKEKRDKIA
jgi:hypothetical protein